MVPGGKVVSVGMGCEHAHLPVSTITVKEIDFMGSFRYANTVRAPCMGAACHPARILVCSSGPASARTRCPLCIGEVPGVACGDVPNAGRASFEGTVYALKNPGGFSGTCTACSLRSMHARVRYSGGLTPALQL